MEVAVVAVNATVMRWTCGMMGLLQYSSIQDRPPTGPTDTHTHTRNQPEGKVHVHVHVRRRRRRQIAWGCTHNAGTRHTARIQHVYSGTAASRDHMTVNAGVGLNMVNFHRVRVLEPSLAQGPRLRHAPL